MSKLLNPTYEDIHDACWGLSKQIRLYEMNIDIIVGVARGGLMPANTMSQMLDIPLIPVSYSSKTGKGDDKNHHNMLPDISNKTILLLDDICDSGHTLREIATHYANKDDLTVFTAAIYYKQHRQPVIIPNLIWVSIPEDSGWVHFPWERDKLN